MYLPKWNEALVDWVNCLALTPKISDLRELESGLFFNSLLKNLIPSDQFFEHEFNASGLDFVFPYLEKEFPLYGVQDIGLERDSKIVYISSLLLLLSVTKRETQQFCSQLCKDLQHDSQVTIKCFLETCISAADKLDHVFLKSIIEGDHVSNEEQSFQSPKRAPGVIKTPLKEFLESPRLTDKLSRDVRRLESEKEALQIEKLELEDELRIEKEKREQLEENVFKKSEQVVKLREELLEYAQSIDELNKGNGISVTPLKIRNLESELRESERYMKALIEERDMVNEEKKKLKEKLVALSDKVKIMEARVLNTVRSNEELQMSISQKEQELQEIKTHCTELKEKIQLLSTQHNNSLDSDTSISLVSHILSSPFSEGERLSQAVVDLKLAEVEADNEKLKSQLDLTQEQSQKLLVQLEEVNVKLGKAKIAQEAAMAENTNVQEKINEFMKEREKLSISLLESNNKILMLTETNTCINEEIADLKCKVTASEDLRIKLDEKICILEKQLRKEQEIQESLLRKLEDEELTLENYESKNKQLQDQITLCMKEKEELQASLQEMNEKNVVLNNEKTLSLKEISDCKFKLTVADETNICLKNDCALLKKEQYENQKKIEKTQEQLDVFGRENQSLKDKLADSENAIDCLNGELALEKQRRCESEENLQKVIESLQAELSIDSQLEEIETIIVSVDRSLSDKLNHLLNFMKQYNLSNRTDKEDIKAKYALLEKDLLHQKQCEQILLDEKEQYEKQCSNGVIKIKELESYVTQLETSVKLLKEQLIEKNSHDQEISLSLKEKQELEDFRSDKVDYLDRISVKEEEINQLQVKISEKENMIQVLKNDRDELFCEKNSLLSVADELRTTIDRLMEEKRLMENEQRELLQWKSLCESPEAKVKPLTHQNHFALVSDLKSSRDMLDKSGEPVSLIENFKLRNDLQSFEHNILQRNLGMTYNVSVKNNSEMEMLVPGDEIKLASQLAIESDINRDLGLENKLWQIIRSAEMLEMYVEKLEEKNDELTNKMAALWKILPNVQLKCNEVFMSKGSSRLMGNEAEVSKELSMHLNNMLIRLEKHKASLEQEKMLVSHRAVSWVLNGIQFSFEGTLTYEDSNQGRVNKPCSGSKEDQENDVSKSLEQIENKFAMALTEVDSTAKLLQEVECRCLKAEDALEYLKSHGKIEESTVNVIGVENDFIIGDQLKVLKESLKEMDKAKLHLEKICRENQEELQKCHAEKNALYEKIDHLTSQNNRLLNELDAYKAKLGSIRQESIEEIKKEYEKKLARVSEKLASAYKDDLEKFSQESDRCQKLEESCKKYKNLIMECQKNLLDMKSYNKSQQQKIETLTKKNALLEEKIYESQLHFGVGDFNHSMNILNRSHSAEHMATYFSRGERAGMESVKYSSENRLYPLNTSNFSRESGRSNLPSGMGQVFCTEDEEGESFNATFLSDLKEGRCDVPHNTASTNRKTLAVLQEQNRQCNVENYGSQPIVDTPTKRLNELMRRNTLCLPHLKSSYPAETQIHDPRNFSEDSLKGNSSLKAPLLSGNQPRRLSGNICGDLRRRKDKGQIAYMKPGPPTPGKNRRSSLQGNEQIAEQKIQSTPGRILSWFGRRRRSVWDAENIPDTPRMKQKGMLRRPGDRQEHDGS